MELKPVMILGASGLGKAALDLFKSNHVEVYGFLDDDPKLHGTEIGELSVLGSIEDNQYLDIIGDRCDAFVAIDESSYRKTVIEMLIERRKSMPVTAIHQQAYVSDTTVLGQGNFINSGVILGSHAEIGNHCILHARALIDFDVKINDFVQVGAGSIINSAAIIEEGVFIGSGVTIVSGVKIAKGARVGAGSVVIKDVGEGETVFGNPAQKV